ncbi:MAG TPA: Gfo/Idh/MocA family oxidoreductase [Pyrinomonadaceae bacterium]|nr:Gfo/Idh/MocA family oxidoreductase [Pyrinomonadaceae bacterium]
MNRTRLGIIGAGGIATRHTNVLRDFPDVNIAAFADQSLDRAQELATLAGAKAYEDFRQMLWSKKRQ